MNIKLVVVGKLKEKYFKQGIAEYAKRLSRFCKFQIVEVADEKAPESLSQAEMDEVMDKEGARILDKIKDREYVYALAILGKERFLKSLRRRLRIDNLWSFRFDVCDWRLAWVIQARSRPGEHSDFLWPLHAASSIDATGTDRADLSGVYD